MSDLEAFAALVPEFLMDLETLVAIDSGTSDPEGVRDVAAHFERWLRELGAEVEVRRERADLGPLLVGHLTGTGRGRILLVGHMDTVYGRDDARQHPFRVDGDRAYGLGTADMKGGCLLALYAMREARRRRTPFGRLTVFLTPDEEIGSPLSTAVLSTLVPEHDVALVLEPGRVDGSVVVGRKAVGSFSVRAHGRSSHAGVAPEHGRSAILELAEQALLIRDYGRAHPEMTLNVGAFHGGSAVNVVPDFAEMGVDVRADDDHAVATATSFLRGLSPRTDGCTLEVEGAFHFPPMPTTDAIRGLYDMARDEAADLGFPLPAQRTGGGSDANHIAALGKPVLDALGPVGGRAHSPEEYIEIPSIARRGALLLRLIARLGPGA